MLVYFLGNQLRNEEWEKVERLNLAFLLLEWLTCDLYATFFMNSLEERRSLKWKTTRIVQATMSLFCHFWFTSACIKHKTRRLSCNGIVTQQATMSICINKWVNSIRQGQVKIEIQFGQSRERELLSYGWFISD